MASTEITQAWQTLAEVPGCSTRYEPLEEERELAAPRQPRARAGDVVYRSASQSVRQVGIVAEDPVEERGYNDSGDYVSKWVFGVRPAADDEEARQALRAAVESVAEESEHLARLGPDDERQHTRHEERRATRQRLLDELREVV